MGLYVILGMVVVFAFGLLVYLMSSSIIAALILGGVAYIGLLIWGWIVASEPPTVANSEGGGKGYKPVDSTALFLSLISLFALIIGLIFFQATTNVNTVLWVLGAIAVVLIPIIVLIICAKKRHTHSVVAPRIVSIVVLVVFAVIAVIAFLL